MKAIEVKSGKTFSPEFASGLDAWMRYSGAKAEDCSLVYAGERALHWKGMTLVPWGGVGTTISAGQR